MGVYNSCSMNVSATHWNSDERIHAYGAVTQVVYIFIIVISLLPPILALLLVFLALALLFFACHACKFLMFTVISHATVLFEYRLFVLLMLVLVVVVV